MTLDHNNRIINNDQQWESRTFASSRSQTTPEDPIPATSHEGGRIPSTVKAAVAARTPLCSTIKSEETTAAAAEGGGTADFPFFPGPFYPGQWWTPNVPFTVNDPWANMNYNPFTTVAQTTQSHPFDPFPSTSMAGGFPSTMAASTTNSFPSYDMGTPNIGYFPTMSLSTATMLKISSANTRNSRVSVSSSSPDLPENLPYKTGRGTNDVRVRTADNYRRVYTDYIRLELEKEYHMSQFITPARKADLAEKLNLTERQIKIWFQNRRAKERKEDPR